jgi:dienelactone hydrolase
MKSLLLFGLLFSLSSPARDITQLQSKSASKHPMRYELSLPNAWVANKTWPVLVMIPDASRDFKATAQAFMKARKALPFILVAPHVVTSGGANYRGADSYRYSDSDWKEIARLGDFRFDSEGIAAVIDDVHRLYGGEQHYFLTGWEAGGHTVWAMLFQHPEHLRAVAPVSTNYRGRWIHEKNFSNSPTRAKLPIKVLFCGPLEGDQETGRQMWLKQSQEAMTIARARGFEEVSLGLTRNLTHGPLADEVLSFFATFLNQK